MLPGVSSARSGRSRARAVAGHLPRGGSTRSQLLHRQRLHRYHRYPPTAPLQWRSHALPPCLSGNTLWRPNVWPPLGAALPPPAVAPLLPPSLEPAPLLPRLPPTPGPRGGGEGVQVSLLDRVSPPLLRSPRLLTARLSAAEGAGRPLGLPRGSSPGKLSDPPSQVARSRPLESTPLPNPTSLGPTTPTLSGLSRPRP